MSVAQWWCPTAPLSSLGVCSSGVDAQDRGLRRRVRADLRAAEQARRVRYAARAIAAPPQPFDAVTAEQPASSWPGSASSSWAEGTKLVSTAINHNVLFEPDDHNVAEGWSVVVKGVARILHDADELAEAERAQLLPWTSTVKQHYVRIRPLGVTGRRFVFGAGIVR
ncbi:hypothetical protein MDOR_32470 [Mycolicibacterium doricum]|uniref:Pyridoxamine 5'-phosphate oxidase family protein n=1 Tax=Mycolicibacterium doricum TaxID=126673 RepID=A0A7I7VZU0_9MYCO|nr:hypothetical protein MDOR_32470 [Mycolicibacterium doricum]